jgi:5'-nucleotidase
VKILLTNDDGINAIGLSELYLSLIEIADVTVVAPEKPRSAIGHAITLHKPLRLEYKSFGAGFGYACNGTPSDCVVIGIQELMPDCDCVVSGINCGPNVGEDLTYSGTVAAAMEAAICNKPGIALSVNVYENPNYDSASKYIKKFLINNFSKLNIDRCFFNINVPSCNYDEIKGVEVTRQGCRKYNSRIEKRIDPRGKTYYWMGGELSDECCEIGTDIHTLLQNKISITPHHLDMTNYKIIDEMKKWKIN